MLKDIFRTRNGEATHGMIISKLFLSLTLSLEMMVGSSMIWGSQIAFVSLQHTLQDIP